ncbi:MAG: molybdenum cofactor guanylyltransferase [Gammaproteobacteria bacterium]|nr:molybdenum cofactor guanylyltransferase [Gammaproteobacteria bacterium]
MTTPDANNNVIGLVLAGGQSTRMGEDKALIDYHGKTQLESSVELLSEFCPEVFVSVSQANQNEETRQQFPTLVDDPDVQGPLAGIISAFRQFPNQTFLVVACDLPLLNRETLQYLLSQRDPGKQATAFISEFDGLPEPLCAIWEPDIVANIQAAIENGKSCPRKVLLNSDIQLIALPYQHALDNINTPDERDALSQS